MGGHPFAIDLPARLSAINVLAVRKTALLGDHIDDGCPSYC